MKTRFGQVCTTGYTMAESQLRPLALVYGTWLACLVACSSDADPIPMDQRPRAAASSAASELPEGIELVDTEQMLSLARQRGSRGLVLNLWASWCGSCREEVPMLLALRDTLTGSGLRLLFVSADEPTDFAKVVALARDWKMSAPARAIVPGTLGQLKRSLGPDWRGGIPATFLLDAKGRLRHLWEGPILLDEIAPVLTRYLEGKTVDGVTRTAASPK